MPALVFSECCGCIDLKIGSFIIAYLNLIGIICATVLTSVSLGIFPVMMKEIKTTYEQSTILLVAVIILAVFLVFLLLALAFAIVLVVGLHKNKPGHLKAYLVYSMIFLVLMVIQLIVTGASSRASAVPIAQNLVSIGLSIYFYLVIRSRYYQMKEESEEGVIYQKNTV